jgi:hypothetical protein
MTIAKRIGVLAVGVGLLTVGLGGVASAAEQDCTTETTGWVTESPGKDWVQVDERVVTDKDATEGSWSEWENEGEPVVTEENEAPGEDTDTMRWILLGETEVEVVTEAQHYSYTGGPIEGQPTDTPPSDNWQANTTQEPHTAGGGTPASNPDGSPYVEGDSGLHYTSAGSSGLADWFYFQPEVTDVDYIWQKQVREFTPGTDAETHKEFKFELTTCVNKPDEPNNPDEPNKNAGPNPPAPTLPATGGNLGMLGAAMSLIAAGSGLMLSRRLFA